MKKIEDISTENFVMKISSPTESRATRVGLMLHGWTGDETSMWVFANNLPDNWLLIAPRAPYPSQSTDHGGFSWIDKGIDHWPTFRDFIPALNDLHLDLSELELNFPTTNFDRIAIFGFSQGAAAAFVYSILFATQVTKLGMLAGFLPSNSEGFIPDVRQTNLEIFLGHGSMDKIVPVSRAEEANHALVKLGYSPHLCISDVGHRLGSECFKAFSNFLNNDSL